MSSSTSQDQLDFRNARTRHFLRAAWGLISGRPTQLTPWDEVRDKLKLRGMINRGVQTVQLDKIVGSVGRYRDFDDQFLPTQNSTGDRWTRLIEPTMTMSICRLSNCTKWAKSILCWMATIASQ